MLNEVNVLERHLQKQLRENDERIEGELQDDEISQEGASSSDNASVDELLVTSNPALDTAPLIPLVAASPLENVSSTPAPKSTSPPPQTVNIGPMPEITLLATPPEQPSTVEGGVLINPEGNVLFEVKFSLFRQRVNETTK